MGKYVRMRFITIIISIKDHNYPSGKQLLICAWTIKTFFCIRSFGVFLISGHFELIKKNDWNYLFK